jgi:hypothetical protein
LNDQKKGGHNTVAALPAKGNLNLQIEAVFAAAAGKERSGKVKGSLGFFWVELPKREIQLLK